MGETKENILLNKLNDSSRDIFFKCLNTLNKESSVKIVFYNFLFSDLIPLDNNNYDIDIYEIVENPENILYNSLGNIFEKMSEYESNINLYNNLKKKLSDKKSTIQNKIKECNSHIEILKNEYININLEKYIPLNIQSKLLFEKKTVLNLKKYNLNLVLGEFFTRFIFSLVNLKEDNNSSIDELCNKSNFYSYHRVNNYMIENDEGIKEFKLIDNNFKYWIFFFFCIGQFFDKDSKYNIIFNDTEFKSYINTLVKIVSPPQKQKSQKPGKKGQQRGQQRGGINPSAFSVIQNADRKQIDKTNVKQGLKQGLKQVTQQISEYQKIIEFKKVYKDIAENIFIESPINLYEKYFKQYDKNMKNYFTSKIDNIQNSGEINIKSNKIENPFNKKDININNIIKTDKQRLLKDNIKKEINNNLNFDIFQSLYLLLDSNNNKEINIFINKLKYNLILILFFLYNIKKKLYENYLLIIKEQFSLNDKKENNKKENNKKENNKKVNNKKENNKKENNKKVSYNTLSVNNKKMSLNNNLKGINKINIKIKLLENKLLTLDDKKGIKNYNEEILNIESQISRLHVQKYNAKSNHF